MTLAVFTVRGGLYDVAPWSPADIQTLYLPELQKLGGAAPQLPVVSWPPLALTGSISGPLRTLAIVPPAPFEAVSQTRDTRVPFMEDPAKLAEEGRAALSVFTWNVCAPAEQLGALRDLFRRLKPIGGLKLSPLVSPWLQAPAELAGYPVKPPAPSCSTGGGAGLVLGILALLGGAYALLRKR